MESGVGNSSAAPLAPVSTPLDIALLGELEVRRGGEPLPLPRSKKCRALIAFLAMNRRPHRRERLCETFWDLPDDPRAALRWSLSKIRRVLGEALVADRDSVSLAPAAVTVDASALLDAAKRLDTLSTEELESIATRCGRGFGEGLDLPRCPEFEAWLATVREDVRQAQLALLAELVGRLRDEPERVLPFARTRAELDPLDERARADLVALLAAAGRGEEAERQRALAIGALGDAAIAVPSALARPVAAAARSPVQRIRFRESADGTRIAWSAAGSGPPLVKTANWMSHLEHEWESPFLGHWLAELSRDRTVIRYDMRGNGLSDRRPPRLSLDAFVEDLDAVAAAATEAPFDLIGTSQGAAVAAAFAALHPDRVRRLILFGGFPAGWRHAGQQAQARWEAMITLTGTGWGTDNPAFRQMFTSLFLPGAGPKQASWFNNLQRVSASPDEAQRLMRAIGAFDVRPLLGRIAAPTIVFHSRGDAMVPFDAGRQLASAIPHAEFVGLESDNHLPLEDEPAWTRFVHHLRDFLAR